MEKIHPDNRFAIAQMSFCRVNKTEIYPWNLALFMSDKMK